MVAVYNVADVHAYYNQVAASRIMVDTTLYSHQCRIVVAAILYYDGHQYKNIVVAVPLYTMVAAHVE